MPFEWFWVPDFRTLSGCVIRATACVSGGATQCLVVNCFTNCYFGAFFYDTYHFHELYFPFIHVL